VANGNQQSFRTLKLREIQFSLEKTCLIGDTSAGERLRQAAKERVIFGTQI